MKIAVFLLCLISFLLPITKVYAGINDRTYSFDNFNIIVDDYFENGEKGISLEKTGTDPFFTTVSVVDETYIVNGIVQINDNFIVFGSAHVTDNPTYYDAMYLVLDSGGTFIKKEIIDYGDLEELRGVYLIDNIFVFHTIKSHDDGISFVTLENYFTTYDLNYNFIDEMSIGSEIKKISSDNNYVYFNYDNDHLVDGAIRDDLTILFPNELIDIANNEVFIDNVNIEFLNQAILNGETISNSIYIDYPGNYKLLYNNAEYNFIVKPTISGIEDNMIYTSSVTPLISAGNILVNNDAYISGTEIDEPGNYELIVNGVNGYIETFNFTITSNMQGIINNHTYLEPLEVTFNGEGFLNNQFVSSPLEVSNIGDYILKIRGENNYLETYYFNISADTDKLSILDFVQRFDIYILVIVLISGGIILKKK